MTMTVIGLVPLEEFMKKHADVRASVQSWLAEAQDAEWLTPQEIKTRYSSADFLSDNRVLLNLKGKHYRLLFKVNYRYHRVQVLKIGTHAEYDKWNL